MNSKIYPENLTDMVVDLCAYVEAENQVIFYSKLFDCFELVSRAGSMLGFALSKYGLKDLKTIKKMVDEELEKERIKYDEL